MYYDKSTIRTKKLYRLYMTQPQNDLAAAPSVGTGEGRAPACQIRLSGQLANLEQAEIHRAYIYIYPILENKL